MKLLVVAAAASTALLVPASAPARPADFRAPNLTPAPMVAATPSHDGFDWGAAAVGAGATGGLVLIAAGGFTAAYRVRARVAR